MKTEVLTRRNTSERTTIQMQPGVLIEEKNTAVLPGPEGYKGGRRANLKQRIRMAAGALVSPRYKGKHGAGRHAASAYARPGAARAKANTAPAHTPLAPETSAPIAPTLRYKQGELHRMVPSGSGKGPLFEAYHQDTTALAPGMRQPLLTAEQTNEQLGPGFEMGPLQGVIHFPGAKEPLYIFDHSTTFTAPDGTEEKIPRYAFATPTQLGKIRTNIEIGRPSREEIYDEILTISRDPRTAVGDVRATIGSKRWLPGRPHGERTRTEVPVPAAYQQVDEKQMRITIDDGGVLILRDLDPALPSVVELNPAYIPAQDPFEGHPMVPHHLVNINEA